MTDGTVLDGPVRNIATHSSSAPSANVIVYYCLVHCGAVAGPAATAMLFMRGLRREV